jgi:FkbM family methyltransferase
MNSFFVRTAFAGISRGLSFRIPAGLRTLEQHCRTIEEIKKRGVGVVIDVGANRGFYSQHLRKSGYTGVILAFEPSPECFRDLSVKAAHDPKWHVFNCALGAEPGEMQFNLIRYGDELVMSSFLEPKFDFPREEITVPVRTLSQVLREDIDTADPRIFLKMDTQGYDLEVFKGAHDAPEISLLQSEVSVIASYEGMPHYTEALATYAKAGFDLLDTFVVARSEQGGIVEFDALLGRPDY